MSPLEQKFMAVEIVNKHADKMEYICLFADE